MNKRELKSLKKFLRYVLCVRPDEFGLLPDDEGFFSIKELLQALREEPQYFFIRQNDLLQLMHMEMGSQMEMDEKRIRFQGIGSGVRPEPISEPPELLYQCVRPRAHPVVAVKGLRPSRHPWVVLSTDERLAMRMGRRLCADPVLIKVLARQAARHGVRFWAFGLRLVLSETIDARFLIAPPAEPPREKPAQMQRPHKTPDMPGSYLLDPERDLFHSRTPSTFPEKLRRASRRLKEKDMDKRRGRRRRAMRKKGKHN